MVGSIRLCLVALVLGLGAITTPVAASTITYHWNGIIQDFDVAPFQDPAVKVGKRITIDLILDDRTPDTDPSPTVGQYDFSAFDPSSPPPLVVDVRVGGLQIPHSYNATWQQATVLNDHNGIDAVMVSAVESHGIGNVFTFNFSTANLAVLTSDRFPLSLDPRDFDVATFSIMGGNGNAEFHPGYRGQVIAATPLPGSVGMFVSALTGLIGAGWWKSRA
jgi:hypothetical protein